MSIPVLVFLPMLPSRDSGLLTRGSGKQAAGQGDPVPQIRQNLLGHFCSVARGTQVPEHGATAPFLGLKFHFQLDQHIDRKGTT